MHIHSDGSGSYLLLLLPSWVICYHPVLEMTSSILPKIQAEKSIEANLSSDSQLFQQKIQVWMDSHQNRIIFKKNRIIFKKNGIIFKENEKWSTRTSWSGKRILSIQIQIQTVEQSIFLTNLLHLESRSCFSCITDPLISLTVMRILQLFLVGYVKDVLWENFLTLSLFLTLLFLSSWKKYFFLDSKLCDCHSTPLKTPYQQLNDGINILSTSIDLFQCFHVSSFSFPFLLFSSLARRHPDGLCDEQVYGNDCRKKEDERRMGKEDFCSFVLPSSPFFCISIEKTMTKVCHKHEWGSVRKKEEESRESRRESKEGERKRWREGIKKKRIKRERKRWKEGIKKEWLKDGRESSSALLLTLKSLASFLIPPFLSLVASLFSFKIDQDIGDWSNFFRR